MKKVLLTGATGFVGRASIASLQRRGFEVHAVSRAGAPVDDAGVFTHSANLLEAGAGDALCRQIRPTHLLHFAWYAIPGKFWNAAENFSWVRASLELLEAFRAAGGTRAVLAGTCAEYDWRHGHCTERVTPLEPATTYGACKSAFGRMTEAYAKETGLSCAWGRIFFPFGPYEYPQRLTSYVIRCLLDGKVAECTDGSQLRDFLYVDDVADAFVTLLDGDVTGPVNIGSGEPLSIAQFLDRIASRLGRPELLRLGAKPNAAGDAAVVTADVTRLRTEVRWRANYALDDAIERTVAYWRAQSV